MILLAPENMRVPGMFQNVDLNRYRYDSLQAELQRLRGSIYLKDGAIEPEELSPDGRHQTPADLESWHILTLDAHGSICGCARYREHGADDPISKLNVAASPLATSDKWGHLLFQAVAAEMELARSLDYALVEFGGWVIKEDFRCTMDAVMIVLSAYSLARILGGCICMSTTTVRHSAADILRRIGGRVLQYDGVELPTYYDSRYKCDMVAFRFDSSAPNPRYNTRIEELKTYLSQATVVCAGGGFRNSQRRHSSMHRWDHTFNIERTGRSETVETN
jgi:hypothetical protein